ncbi:uncharacterized protein PHACADRAFT_214142 [Phanerochaete carnosa HHB-10118-sp]|uniref:HpcH/HpaI aldolase/citrate lyase domain-containing protein n=1 Tax=Phanerochaete carnosa (strain HHB-10118-sp) TaxID=650164 RepID=K5WH99_PHACS|nr:uncharacterized protein PHACADRAFT_214142 [Phanerochaete carnosa HHB-10118-sp]EKM49597.1 hypothetical protein PHACADRAFT_214142 [Phanerochaete carnosa HHB-10118-sp]
MAAVVAGVQHTGCGQPDFQTFLPLRCCALLYLPTSSDRTLNKSLVTHSDVIVYDLEDSVPPTRANKEGARGRLSLFITDKLFGGLPQPERLAVRVNAVNTPFFQDDITQALVPSCIRTLVIPKVHSIQELDVVSTQIHAANSRKTSPDPVNIVASIESARALYNVGEIAGWQSKFRPELGGKLTALLFAAEDYCADTKIIRTKTRQELLYTRSQISITARAFGLESIDMVCVDYKDSVYLKDECDDGRRLGFTGKQAIHPNQVEVIHSSFLPTTKEILRAARILRQMEKAHGQQRGAAGLVTEDGGLEMIDQPMIKQAEYTIRTALAAGLEIPKIE